LAWAAGVIGYVVVAVLTARLFVRADLERAARHALKDRRDAARYVKPGADAEERERWASVQGSLITQNDRDESARLGLTVGAGWPIFWLFTAALALVAMLAGLLHMGARKMSADIVPQAERDRLAAITQRRERQELDLLRKQARDLSLPFPRDDA
jgi:Flp pilus assembly protein TadB